MTHNDIIPIKAYELAKERGFDSVITPDGLTRWNGYKVFAPYKAGHIRYCGLPQFILMDNKKNLRYATEEENHLIIFNC